MCQPDPVRDVLWLTWVVAIEAPAVIVVLRLSGLDERRLLPIRLAGFINYVLAADVVAALVHLALLRLGIEHPVRAPLWWAVVVAFWVAELLTRSPIPRRTTGAAGSSLVIGSCNVERGTTAAEAIAGTLLAADVDVLLVQEYTPDLATAFRSTGLLAAYPHVREDPDEGWFGAAILSRHPILTSERRELGQRPMTLATLDVDGEQVVVVNVHTQAPIYGRDVTPWRTAFLDLTAVAREAEGLLVMAGDWNATLRHQPLRRLLRTGIVVDAHLASRRRRVPRTWPTGRRHPPLLCLDHMLISPLIEVTAAAALPIAGTDHKALRIALRLPG